MITTPQRTEHIKRLPSLGGGGGGFSGGFLIWDLDGTLLDTLQDLANSTNYALRTWGLPERTIDEVRQFVGNGVRMLMTRAVPQGEAHPHFEEIFDTFKSHYVEHCQDNTCLYPGIAETLQALKARGIRMAVVSNKLQAGVTELHEAWFKDTIDVAIGERPEVRRKPAPDMVMAALSELASSAHDPIRAIYIGDSEVDILTAANAGIPCISVLWGFRDKDFLIQNGATTLVSHPQEIISLVIGE